MMKPMLCYMEFNLRETNMHKAESRMRDLIEAEYPDAIIGDFESEVVTDIPRTKIMAGKIRFQVEDN